MKLLFLTLLFIAAFFLVFASLASTERVQQEDSMEKAVFAGGCFWCMEKPFEKEPGVISVISGYTAGQTEAPTYENYLMGGHIEAVQVTYNPTKVSYERLLDIFWRQIDPTDPGGQFVDRGHGYISAIFYSNDQQKKSAIASKNKLASRMIFSAPIVTEIIPLQTMYPAEEYHQDYYKKNPLRYSFYRNNSGRDQFLRKIWGDSDGTTKWSDKELRKKLTPLQFEVTQENGTEPPFSNALWDNKREGIYVDIVSGEPLFSSRDKFDSGTGWPSFSQPLVPDNIQEREDNSLFSRRTEVRSTKGNSHLGHLFDDGPMPSHLRYCINSAALRFVGLEEFEEEGYGYLLPNFK